VSDSESASQMNKTSILDSPDFSAAGFLETMPDAARYDGLNYDPDEVAMRIARLVPPGARVLDVGCGTASLGQVVREISMGHVVGIEPDASRVSIARRTGIEVHQGYLTDELVAALGTFDVVIFADVLEHIPDPHRAVLTARKALKTGGKILISVPNVAHWSVRLSLLQGRFEYAPYGIMDATHLRWFTRATIVSFLNRLGFAVISVRFTIGAGLPVYSTQMPWRWLRWHHKRTVLRNMVRCFPSLFACQLVVEARPCITG